MPDYKWPKPEQRTVIGKAIPRVDGPAKASGEATYTSDVKRPDMLWGKILRCPHAHARIKEIDISAAERMPGVKAVRIIQEAGTEIFWAADEIAAVAAVNEPTAEDAIRAILVEYEVLPHYVVDTDPGQAGEMARPTAEEVKGDPDSAFEKADVVAQGLYGMPVIAHCCMESHGSVSEWDDENLLVHISTQSVSSMPNQIAEALGIPAGNVRVKMDHIGGGFGSKFNPDRWGIETARLSRLADGKPVTMMLERDAEMTVAGSRPSSYARVKLGANKDGTLLAWQSESWGTGGMGGGGRPPLPYIFDIPNQQIRHTAIANHIGSARAWRAPNHPQACLITMAAIEDLAAELGMDPLQLILKNLDLTGRRAGVYREELLKAAELVEWEKNWHPRGITASGPHRRGLGLAIHRWGGRGHGSNCDITIHPDGSVEIKIGTQDLGTGTRTIITMVVAETLGLPMEAVSLRIGDTRYPVSGSSGGSTTVGGVSSSTRRAAVDALEQLFEKVAPSLDAKPAELEAVDGTVRVKTDPNRSLTWKKACARIGGIPITARGQNPGPGNLSSSGVGGVQMADVSVDIETGIVKINKLVAVQDCGLIINPKLAESQCYGGMIMGIGYALYEEKIVDRLTGRVVNPNMEFYKLAGMGDIGELVVHLMITEDHDSRGVIGLGEPPVISPGAAISNAVANAIGVRVRFLPLTPDRILEALAQEV